MEWLSQYFDLCVADNSLNILTDALLGIYDVRGDVIMTGVLHTGNSPWYIFNGPGEVLFMVH